MTQLYIQTTASFKYLDKIRVYHSKFEGQSLAAVRLAVGGGRAQVCANTVGRKCDCRFKKKSRRLAGDAYQVCSVAGAPSSPSPEQHDAPRQLGHTDTSVSLDLVGRSFARFPRCKQPPRAVTDGITGRTCCRINARHLQPHPRQEITTSVRGGFLCFCSFFPFPFCSELFMRLHKGLLALCKGK